MELKQFNYGDHPIYSVIHFIKMYKNHHSSIIITLVEVMQDIKMHDVEKSCRPEGSKLSEHTHSININ